ncbi:hypothetical protein AAG747_00800 [Rapidithrix thailandica]|uniref:Uncharacterized protein n=1 Tax=Rapidithrix thailandica TaxID=413964 RepID=A0AAW9S4W8_9BACT
MDSRLSDQYFSYFTRDSTPKLDPDAIASNDQKTLYTGKPKKWNGLVKNSRRSFFARIFKKKRKPYDKKLLYVIKAKPTYPHPDSLRADSALIDSEEYYAEDGFQMSEDGSRADSLSGKLAKGQQATPNEPPKSMEQYYYELRFGELLNPPADSLQQQEGETSDEVEEEEGTKGKKKRKEKKKKRKKKNKKEAEADLHTVGEELTDDEEDVIVEETPRKKEKKQRKKKKKEKRKKNLNKKIEKKTQEEEIK